MPSRKTGQVIGVEELFINIRRYIKIFIAAAIHKIDLERCAFVGVPENGAGGNGLRIFRQCLFDCFRGNAGQEVVGFDHLFAFFFRGMSFLLILDQIRVQIFHKVAVNGLYLFYSRGLRNAQQLTVIVDLFHDKQAQTNNAP